MVQIKGIPKPGPQEEDVTSKKRGNSLSEGMSDKVKIVLISALALVVLSGVASEFITQRMACFSEEEMQVAKNKCQIAKQMPSARKQVAEQLIKDLAMGEGAEFKTYVEKYSDSTPTGRLGIEISSIRPTSRFAELGFKEGEVLLSINGTTISGTDQPVSFWMSLYADVVKSSRGKFVLKDSHCDDECLDSDFFGAGTYFRHF